MGRTTGRRTRPRCAGRSAAASSSLSPRQRDAPTQTSGSVSSGNARCRGGLLLRRRGGESATDLCIAEGLAHRRFGVAEGGGRRRVLLGVPEPPAVLRSALLCVSVLRLRPRRAGGGRRGVLVHPGVHHPGLIGVEPHGPRLVHGGRFVRRCAPVRRTGTACRRSRKDLRSNGAHAAPNSCSASAPQLSWLTQDSWSLCVLVGHGDQPVSAAAPG